MSNLLFQLALGAALVVPQGGQAAGPGPGRHWETVELPAGFVLDLGTGVVASRDEDQRPSLTYARGALASLSPLRLLPPALDAPRVRIDRDGGEAVPGVEAVVGQELVFDCFGEAWGYLRVLEVAPESVTLEFLLEPDLHRRELVREPGLLEASSGPRGVELQWQAESGTLYRVERRRMPRGVGERRGEWREVARVAGGRWLDDELSLGHFNQYRVSRLGQGGGFGSTAFGVAGVEPQDTRVEVGPGTELNLLSATTDDLRVDLTVEYVRTNGVQLYPGEGIEARYLSAEEERDWVLSEVDATGYRKQRFFRPPHSVLALRLPEGVHVLLRIEGVEGERVTLSRQIDLTGERVFPPTPELPEARWESGRGVVFEFAEPRKAPPQGQPVLVVEREETLNAGDWAECARGAAGERRLVDEELAEKLLVRYRFRQGLEGGQLSSSSEPLTVLVGGDSDESRAALLERAILDLGSEDFDRRSRARAVLLALGEGAWPILRDALRSGNAELASAAKELLRAGADQDDETSGNLARLLIRIRAEELGFEFPPHPDWVSPRPGARASAALRGLGWRQTSAARIADWRHVLAEADPEESVRLTAGLAALLGAQGLGPDLGPRFPSRERSTRAEAEWLADLDLEAPAESPKSRPWSRLVELQARHELDGARAATNDVITRARENGVLARFLTAHYDRTDDELFLDCALRLIEDPIARLRGAVDFARSQRRSDRFGDGGAPPRVVRLEAPETELLMAELELLRGSDLRGVEIVLPAGIYEPLAEGQHIVLDGVGLRLRGEGSVELHVNFTLMKGCSAVFDNLSIVPETATAVNVMHSSLVLRDCLVRGGSYGIQGVEALVELERSAVITPRAGAPSAAGVSFSGRSMFLASESRIESPGVALRGARAALLDRCVVLSSHLVGVEGTEGSDLWLVNTLVHADKAPFTRVTRGVLDGAILYGDVEGTLAKASGMRICAEHLRCDAPLAKLDRGLWLERCALGH